LVAGCRSEPEQQVDQSIRQVTEDLISTEVAAQAGLGDLTPTCPDIDAAVVGTAWQCSATTENQQVVAVDAVIDDAGRVKLNTTNLITAAALPSFERAAVVALNTSVGSQLTDDAVDCGEQPVLFPSEPAVERQLVCALLDPHNQLTYDVTLTIGDIETRQFGLVVADLPRS
jgi:hypothetical protein